MKFNICNLYIFSWCAYNVQGILYPEGGLISLVFLLFCIAVSFYYIPKVLKEGEMPLYIKGLIRFLLVLSFYGVIYMLFGENLNVIWRDVQVNSYIYIKQIWMSLLPIFPLYYFTIKGQLNMRMLQIWVWLFCVVVIICMIKNFIAVQQAILDEGSLQEENNMNAGYLFLSLMPAVFLYKRTYIRYLLAIFCVVFILICMKRGAILIGGLCMIYFIYNSLKYSNKSAKLFTLFLAVVLIFVVIWIFEYKMATSAYFLYRLEGTLSGSNTSGRDTMYETLFTYFLDNSFIYQLVGEGANATFAIIGNYAHNDWLEILVNQGLLGLFVYLIYWVNFVRNISEEKRERCYMTADILRMTFIILFMKTFFSMAYADMTIYTNCIMAFALGYRNQQKYLSNLYGTNDNLLLKTR